MMRFVASALALRIVGVILWLLFTVISARVMTVEEFGYSFYFINLVMAGGAIVVIGYDTTMLRIGTSLVKKGDYAGFRALLKEARIGVLFASGVAGLLAITAIEIYSDKEYLDNYLIVAVTLLSLVATGLMRVERDALRAMGRMVDALFAFSVIRVAVPLVICVLAAISFGLGSRTVILAFFAGLLCSLVWNRTRLGQLNQNSHGVDRKRYFRTAIEYWPGNISLEVTNRAPVIILGLVGGVEGAALFIAAERISQLSSFLTDAVRTAVGPSLAGASNDLERSSILSYASFLFFISNGLGVLFLLVFGALILSFLGSEYDGALSILSMLLLGQLSWVVFGPTALTLNMMGEGRVRSVVGSVYALLMLLVLPFASSAWTVSVIVAATAWLTNLSLWFAIYLRLNMRCGVFGIDYKSATARFMEDFVDLRKVVVDKLSPCS